MPSVKQLVKINTKAQLMAIKNALMSKYYNLFCSNIEIEGVTAEQKEYITRQLFAKGTIAVFKPNDKINDLVAFCPYAAQKFNLYDQPTEVQLINTRNSPIIPNKTMKVNEDVVLGYLNKDRHGAAMYINAYVDRLVQIEGVINTNLTLHKMPFLLNCSSDNREMLNNLMNKVLENEPIIATEQSIQDSIDVLNTNTPYIIDKLKDYEKELDGELLTILGINNVAIEKKERLISDEANSNNQAIKTAALSMQNELNDFAKKIKEVLNYNVKFRILTLEMFDEEEKKEDDENVAQ